MGGRSGSSAPTETTVTNTDLPDYVEPYFKRLLQRGEAESLQGYQPYGGQRLSYFSPDELTSQAMTRGFATSGTPQQFTDASARYGATQGYGTPQYTAGTFDSGYGAGNLGQTYQAGDISSQYQAGNRQSGYQAGDVGTQYNPANYEQNISRFMSPYQQNVIDVEKREASRQSNIMGKGIGDAATAQGSLGGYREAIQQAERERNLGQQLGDIQTRGSQAGFQSAQQQLAAERASELGAAQFGLSQFGAQQGAMQQQEQLGQGAFAFGEQSRQQQEKLGQSGFQLGQQAQQQQGTQEIQAYQAGENARAQAAKLGLSAQQQEDAAKQAQEKFTQSGFDMSNRYNLAAAQGLMGAGETINQDAVSRISALQGIGSQQRALDQASMDMGYEDFLRQRDFSKQQLSDFGGVLRGVPVTPQQRVSQYSQQPGLFQQAVGAGLTGLGLYRGAGG